ncbi:MAG TPA: Do family serine endopeptidase [Bryobacteraceae bacterium]|nr:Do family serine endopeptidase [Bryobacteraceae bacterium]
MKQQKLLSLSLLIFTLSIGIVIGTLVNTGVGAKTQTPAPDATPLVIPSASQMSSEFSKLAKRLEPSVVNISTDYTPKQTTASRNNRRPTPDADEESDEDAMDLFRRFFRNGPGGGNGAAPPNLPPRAFRREATGSGFIVDKNGYILTNNHVVEKADHIKVKMPHDQTEYRAKLIGVDIETDLAIIKIDAGKPLIPTRIGNSDAVQVGDWAVAIGSPFGLEATVTAGIVSATGRDVPGAQQFQHFIQTDAAINPGNSGGPLLNINGEVIGINTAIATQSGGYQGIGFALPVNTAVAVYNSIIRTGKMSRGSIGIQFNKYEKSPQLLKALGLKEGVVVEKVTPGGPAEKSGMKAEDVIVAFNGKSVKDGDDLVSRVAQSPVGSTATATVDRAGKKLDLKLTIADREEQLLATDDPRYSRRDKEEEPGKADAKEAKFGISIRNLTQAEREAAGMEDKRGVVVTQVQENSFADEIGLQERDLVVSINRQPVASVDDVRKVQTTLKVGDAVAFRVMRPSPAGPNLPGGGRSGRGGTPQFNSFYLSGTLTANP